MFAQTKEDAGNKTVRIESFNQDVARVFIEVRNQYLEPIPTQNTQRVAEQIQHTQAFLTERIIPFLDQFDKPSEEEQR
jgi:hypothetical protein